jgi:hypothetical protein
MSVINRFQRVDERLAKALPQWPVSLVMLTGVCAGVGLALLLTLL